MLIQAYFGENAWFSATILIIMSLISILLAFIYIWKNVVNLMPLTFSLSNRKANFYEPMTIILLIAIALFEICYLILNNQNINWYTVQDEDFRIDKFGFIIFIFLFKFFVVVNVVLYAIIRDRLGHYFRVIYIALSLVYAVLFFVIALKLGNRTDILALSLGIFTYHLYRDKFNYIRILKIFFSFLIIGTIFYIIEMTRYEDNTTQLDFWGGIIAKDWYAPAHILFAAVRYGVIDPVEVLLSNSSNALVMIRYPYLQNLVTEIFNPGVATRSAGYAFYILTEGYMVLGNFGFIYNSFLILFGWAMWRKFASTENKCFNNLLLGLMGCMLVNLVRGQSSYFIKYFYTFVIPGAFLYSVLSGQSLTIKIKKTFILH
jgi:hypothetical protein